MLKAPSKNEKSFQQFSLVAVSSQCWFGGILVGIKIPAKLYQDAVSE